MTGAVDSEVDAATLEVGALGTARVIFCVEASVCLTGAPGTGAFALVTGTSDAPATIN